MMESKAPKAGPIKAPEPVYIGDGLYALFDGYGIWLHANHHEHPSDRVYLEPHVLGKLILQFNAWTEEANED